MHYKSFGILILLFQGTAFGQSVYQSSNYASPQDSFIVSQISLPDIDNYDYQLSGQGVTWDFSGFNPISQRVVRYIDPNRTGFGAVYLFSCNARCYTDCYNSCVANGTPAFLCAGSCNLTCNATCFSNWVNRFDLAEVANDSINLGITTIRDIYNFFDLRTDALEQVAVGARVSGFPVMIEYAQPDRIYRFPVAYGNTDSSYSNYSLKIDSIPGVTLPVSFYYNHGQRRYNYVEGWGTLKTPYGTFTDVLKVKSVIYNYDTIIFQNDTLALADFLPGQIIPNQEIEYKWLSPAYGIPLLSVSAWVVGGTLIYQNLDYIDSLRCFEPASIFGYVPFPAIIGQNADSVEISFYSLSVNANTFEWFFDDGSSPASATGNAITHVYTEGGIYNVALVSCNTGCTQPLCDTFTLPVVVIDLSQDSVVGVRSAEKQTATVFPNPFAEEIQIVFPCFSGSWMVQLSDVRGRVLFEKHSTLMQQTSCAETIKLSELLPGTYFLQIAGNRANIVRKLIKIR
ncbi:MAG: hypothetical protein KatS3mg031_2265 [Chitinophagales bacterium]|nr:MAG: hypothetical protein KatS3mg031_2265 [Chitinophagales bacterium]